VPESSTTLPPVGRESMSMFGGIHRENVAAPGAKSALLACYVDRNLSRIVLLLADVLRRCDAWSSGNVLIQQLNEMIILMIVS